MHPVERIDRHSTRVRLFYMEEKQASVVERISRHPARLFRRRFDWWSCVKNKNTKCGGNFYAMPELRSNGAQRR